MNRMHWPRRTTPARWRPAGDRPGPAAGQPPVPPRAADNAASGSAVAGWRLAVRRIGAVRPGRDESTVAGAARPGVGRRAFRSVAVRVAVAAVTAGAAVAGVTALTGAPAGAAVVPVQVITVRAAAASSTTAVLEAWQRTTAGSYKRVYGPVTAYIGKQGIGAASETLSRTPAGQFTLTEGFGIAANPGTTMPYRKVDGYDWWVSDTRSKLYNTHQRCAAGHCTFNERVSERLAAAGAVYANAMVINYNRSPVRAGAGSAFFLHVSNGRPTAGCVAIPAANLVWLMRWLKPANHPIISMGVGWRAYLPIPSRWVP